MNRITLVLIASFASIYSCLAQFDEKFYFPSKEWHPIENANYSEMNFFIDNDTINAALFTSQTPPKATIIYYHGNGGNISQNNSIANLLSKDGYQVFMMDYRGYGKSTGQPSHINIAKDAQIIFDEIIMRDEFKNTPIIIYGASIGTQIATKITRDNKDKVTALILDGAISSFTDMAVLSVPEEQKEMIAQYVSSPYSAQEDIKHIASIPQLFIHSREDRAVPFKQGEVVYNNANSPKEQWIYKGKHLEAPSKYPILFLQKINALFEAL